MLTRTGNSQSESHYRPLDHSSETLTPSEKQNSTQWVADIDKDTWIDNLNVKISIYVNFFLTVKLYISKNYHDKKIVIVTLYS